MEVGELIACLVCIFLLAFSSVLYLKLAVKVHGVKILKTGLLFVWLLAADETGQGMLALSGALKGQPDAQANLGLNYLSGHMEGSYKKTQGIQLWWPSWPDRGKYWLDKATASGDAKAAAVMAQAYMNGTGVARDPLQASNYLLKIIDNKGADKETVGLAAFNLYELYSNGDGVQQDPVKAFNYLLIASGTGNGEASFKVAKEYEAGNVVPADYGKAFSYYKAAMKDGYMQATGDYERMKQELGQR